MATISLNDRRRNAALFSAFYQAASQQVAGQLPGGPMIAVPAGMRPIGFDRAADFYRSTDVKSSADVTRAYCSSLWALKNSRCRAETRALLAAGRQTDGEAARVDSDDDDEAVSRRFGEIGSRRLPRQPPIVKMSISPRTWITSVAVTFTTQVQNRAEAIQLVKFAFPANWSKASKSFFKVAELGRMEGSRFVADEEPRLDYRRGEPVFLHERVSWPWNDENDFESDNHFLVTFDAIAPEVPAGRNDRAPETLLEYQYTLAASNWTKSYIIWDDGGLDVDQGTYKAELRGRDLTITATKSVRFTTPREAPYEIGVALNMMAPATVSMLLSRLNDYAAVHNAVSHPEQSDIQWPRKK